jgi:hypothetical protein
MVDPTGLMVDPTGRPGGPDAVTVVSAASWALTDCGLPHAVQKRASERLSGA